MGRIDPILRHPGKAEVLFDRSSSAKGLCFQICLHSIDDPSSMESRFQYVFHGMLDILQINWLACKQVSGIFQQCLSLWAA